MYACIYTQAHYSFPSAKSAIQPSECNEMIDRTYYSALIHAFDKLSPDAATAPLSLCITLHLRFSPLSLFHREFVSGSLIRKRLSSASSALHNSTIRKLKGVLAYRAPNYNLVICYYTHIDVTAELKLRRLSCVIFFCMLQDGKKRNTLNMISD